MGSNASLFADETSSSENSCGASSSFQTWPLSREEDLWSCSGVPAETDEVGSLYDGAQTATSQQSTAYCRSTRRRSTTRGRTGKELEHPESALKRVADSASRHLSVLEQRADARRLRREPRHQSQPPRVISADAKTVGGPTESEVKPHDEVFIIFDWDDTLFPTSFYLDVLHGKWERIEADPTLFRLFQQCASHVRRTLVSATKLAGRGHVAIVTLADRQWFNYCCQRCLPDLDFKSLLAELDIRVLYGFDFSILHDYSSFFGNVGTSSSLSTHTTYKRRAISSFLPQPSRWGEAKWHCVTIGDSDAEHDALISIAADAGQKALCVTVKLPTEPPLERLISQLQSVSDLLPAIVSNPTALHLEITARGALDRLSGEVWSPPAHPNHQAPAHREQPFLMPQALHLVTSPVQEAQKSPLPQIRRTASAPEFDAVPVETIVEGPV